MSSILRTSRREQRNPVAAPLANRKPFALALLLACFSCGTEATGLESCRKIEAARCAAAVVCGLVEDADACVRFSQGNCLHGFPEGVEDNSTDVASCVETLENASECVEEEGEDVAPADCGTNSWAQNPERTVCAWVQKPETAPNCDFLIATDDDDDDDDDEAPADTSSDVGDAGTP